MKKTNYSHNLQFAWRSRNFKFLVVIKEEERLILNAWLHIVRNVLFFEAVT